jgi:pyridoxal phosphate enzyme (YggS family)
MTPELNSIHNAWQTLQDRLNLVCAGAHREPASIRVIAVSKVQPAQAVMDAVAAGLTDFGENRVQEAASKIPQVEPRPVWHLVGHLQSNKAKRAVQLFDWVQSVDSPRMARVLGQAAAQAESRLNVLVQVNTTAEGQKSGCEPADLESVIEAVREQDHLNLGGLMTIGPLSMQEAPTRAAFKVAAELRERWRSRLPAGCMDVLSMGMSGDWPWAIEEGADWIRVGTAIFGPRNA